MGVSPMSLLVSLLHIPLQKKDGDLRSSSCSSEMHRFHQWLDEMGVERRAQIAIDESAGGGRGLVATERIEPGEVAIRIPLSATLTLEGGGGGHHDDDDDDDQWAGILANILVDEQLKGSESFFEPYLTVGLPEEAPITPCSWSSEEKTNLQNATLMVELEENAAWQQRQLQTFRPTGSTEEQNTFLRMLGLVCSRTLKSRKNGSRHLVPLIDIANHVPQESGGGHFRIDRDAVVLIAGNRGVDQGQSLTMDYGARHVDDFLLHYGFVPDRCPSDSVTIVSHDNRKMSVTWGDCHGSSSGHPSEAIRDACSKLLEAFPTTLSEDAKELNVPSGTQTYAQKCALEYRFAKKSLLASAAGANTGRRMFAFGDVEV